MKEKTYFLNMFSDYEPPESLQSALSQAAVSAADIDPERRKIAVILEKDTYIPQRYLEQAQKDICTLYGLRDAEFTAVHPASELHKIEPDELLQMFVRQNSMTRGLLAGVNWQWDDNTLTIRLAVDGEKIILECVPGVREQLRRRFGVNVTVNVQTDEMISGKALFDAMEKLRLDAMAECPVAVSAPKKEVAAVASSTFFGKPFRIR